MNVNVLRINNSRPTKQRIPFFVVLIEENIQPMRNEFDRALLTMRIFPLIVTQNRMIDPVYVECYTYIYLISNVFVVSIS